jgi:hypothetical protein
MILSRLVRCLCCLLGDSRFRAGRDLHRLRRALPRVGRNAGCDPGRHGARDYGWAKLFGGRSGRKTSELRPKVLLRTRSALMRTT